MVGWYGGSEEYALISSLRFSRETFRKQRLQAPISVTPEHHRKADRQMLVDAISPSHSPTLSRIPVDGQAFRNRIREGLPTIHSDVIPFLNQHTYIYRVQMDRRTFLEYLGAVALTPVLTGSQEAGVCGD